MNRFGWVKGVLVFLVLAVPFWVTAQDLCWKASYGRGAGTIPADCEFSQEKQGLLCYPKCKAGFTGVAFVCWQDCPAGYRDDGAFCAKPEPYGRGAGYPWVFGDPLDDSGMFARCQRDNGSGNCEKIGAIVYPKCKPGFHAVGSNICSPDCRFGMEDIGVSCRKQTYTRETLTPACGTGQIYDAGLCYQRCNSGYTGVGPVCWGECPTSHPVECGASCTVSQDACAQNVTDQVLSVLEVAADITLTVATAGGGTAAVSAAKIGVKQGTKIGFSQAAKSLGKNLSKATISDQIKKAAVKAGKEVSESTAEAWGAALVEAGTTGEFEWESLDPTGIASIVKAYNHPICSAPPAGTGMGSAVASAGPGCGLEGSAKSGGGGQAVQITFRNSTAGPVKIYWLDYNGRRQPYRTLAPGESYTQSTYAGHPWLVADSADKCIGLFQSAATATFNITPP